MRADFSPEGFNQMVPHPVQSYEWGEFRRGNGAGVERFTEGDKAYTVTFHKLPAGGWSLGVMTQSHFPNQKVVEKLKSLGEKHGAISIKIEPYVYIGVAQAEKLTDEREKLKDLGLVKGKPLYPLYSFLIDLTKTEEELLNSMKSKTRYNVNLAKKKNLTIEVSDDDKAFKAYLKLLLETTKRQAFYAHTLKYQQKMWEALKQAGIAKVITASLGDEALAAFVLFEFNGRLYYPYGASTRRHRELMAPQLLMWEAMRYGKTKGYGEFEMWGCLGPEPDSKHSWFGFHRFKAGFGGEHIEYVGAYDLVLSPIWYRLYQAADGLRWWWLKRGK